jgi:hypothetical protein
VIGLAERFSWLAWAALPLWLAAGGADWLCHRRARIERTSGAGESLLHIVLFLLVAIPIALALFYEMTALLMAIAAVAVVAHMACSWWDTAFSQPRRYIAPIEQMVHSHLEMLPLFGLAIVTGLYWDSGARQWALVPRASAVPATGLVLSGLALGLLFILEELWRCLRATRTLSDPPASAAPP